MAGTPRFLAETAYLANAAADVLTTPAATPAAGTYYIIRHIHVANVTAGAVTFTLYYGATGGSAAGTELFKAKSVAANDVYDYWCYMVVKNTKYISGLASAATSLTISIEGEVCASSS